LKTFATASCLLLITSIAFGQISPTHDGFIMSFDTKVVRSAPYSAVAEVETLREASGNSIRQVSKTMVWRDAEGRTRREFEFGTDKPWITILDPVAGVRYSFRANRRTATRTPIGPPPAVIPAKNSKKLRPTIESLGERSIEGLKCEGKRTTTVYPVNSIGNSRPLRVVTEEWFSPDLQVLLVTLHDDPRLGKTTYRLMNIDRRAPDVSLFQPPAGVAIEDAKLRR
jgi:hypothetical protein